MNKGINVKHSNAVETLTELVGSGSLVIPSQPVYGLESTKKSMQRLRSDETIRPCTVGTGSKDMKEVNRFTRQMSKGHTCTRSSTKTDTCAQ